MAKNGTNGTARNKTVAQKSKRAALVAPAADARILSIASRGIRTTMDFANFMSALMSDLVTGKVAPPVGNAACNAGGKLLKVVELQQRYAGPKGGSRTLALTA